jgi:membrane peptidoglycan carboxypeptidase
MANDAYSGFMARTAPTGGRANAHPLITLLIAALGIGVLTAALAIPPLALARAGVNQASNFYASFPKSLDEPALAQPTVLLAADGTRLASLYDQYRVERSLNKISKIMQRAIIDVEDVRFYEHHGIDWRGTARALVTNLGSGGVSQGGSTITQQYVKNVLVLSAKTTAEAQAAASDSYTRKIREARYALALERKYTKDQILDKYLNIAYFGHSAYGVEAAAHRFFSTTAAQLTTLQAASIAGLVQSPGSYDPILHPHAATERRNAVLDRMLAAGDVTAAQAAAYKKIPLASYLKPSEVPNGCPVSKAPFFCDYVVQTLLNDPALGKTYEARDELLRRGGLRIYTTLDWKTQNAAQKSVNDHLPAKDPSKKAAAIAMVEPQTGDVLALAENRVWGTSGLGNTTYNYAVDAAHGGTVGMQAGSTMKAFTMAAALENGYGPYTTINSPGTRTFTHFKGCGSTRYFEPWTVSNDTGNGTFTMVQAAAYSVNTYFAALEEMVGVCKTVDVAASLGLKTGSGKPLDKVPSFTLGSQPVTPLAMASAYGGFANHGLYCPPTSVLRIVDVRGKPVPISVPRCKQAVPAGVADTVTQILRGVIDGPLFGRTGAGLSPGVPAAGKTGTNEQHSAVWFVGYTPTISAAVWVGDPRGGFRYPLKNITIDGQYYTNVFGRSIPGPIWQQALRDSLSGTPTQYFNLNPTYSVGLGGPAPSPKPTPTTKPTATPTAGPTNSPTGIPSWPGSPTPSASPTGPATARPVAGKPTKGHPVTTPTTKPRK